MHKYLSSGKADASGYISKYCLTKLLFLLEIYLNWIPRLGTSGKEIARKKRAHCDRFVGITTEQGPGK